MADVRRPRFSVGLLFIASLVLVVGALAFFAVRQLPACTFVATGQCTRVLFIGNSYTSVNDLPGVFARVAASGGHPVETGMVAPGGAFLADAVANPDVAAQLANPGWSFVVLQEQSQRPAAMGERDRFAGAVTQLAATARAAGARPLLLETWAHRAGWPEAGMSFAAMQAAIAESYAAASAATGAAVAPAGEAWARAASADVGAALWQDDGSHPTPAGTYLVACVLYRSMFGSSPVGLGDHGGLPDDVAARLQAIAAGG